ncbi:tRNA 4-thiouridine(8) synthase ThiI [Thermomicrobium sp. CFH 73360]|uniref:tRNA uracil 4-sulfurtransferase ThiI n=1 Tax=Thermomicrobium sp. CFH 73360 TaxID=2951987 RepID=UPI0020773623|nr:tRNA uracil 4-sulfurtransferase ThiI [Thermomicrobium sp. CFH 73360]MCM8746856.1 tRNA 4-thiouridine(8) synthase ThiI [Thermomicrobium sp. CFH 73360]
MSRQMTSLIIARVHELALKGQNRPFFKRALYENLRYALRDLPVSRLQERALRYIIRLEDSSVWPEVAERLRWVFGVANFSLGLETALTVEAMQQGLAELLERQGPPPGSFRIRVKRTNKAFPLTSPELERELGRFVQRRTGAPVNLTRPDVTYQVEVLYDRALVSGESLPGPGGLPMGVSGRVVALLSGGYDSPVAAYRLMKRGCFVTFVHFHAYPYVRPISIEKVVELARHLSRYQPPYNRLVIVPIGDAQREIALAAEASLRVVLYRRLMLRLATEIAREEGAGAIVTGESLGQVASQTLENMRAIGAVTDLPLLRPLVGNNKDEIIAEAVRIGTERVSRIPDDDCCTVFVPLHPATRVTTEQAEAAERAYDVAALVERCLARRTVYEGDPFRWDPLAALAAATA